MRRFSVPLYVALVFASGALVGSLGYRLYNVRTVDGGGPANARHRLSPEEFRRQIVAAMRSRLSLSDDQVTKLQAAFDETRKRFEAFDQRSKAEAKVERRAILDAQHERIRSFLTAPQRAEYEKFLEERHQERQRQRLEEQKQRPGS